MATGIVESLIEQQKWIDELSEKVQPVINDLFNNAGENGRSIKDLLNGVWLGHPLHPMLTDVPVGAWTMTQFLDLVSMALGDDEGLDRAADLTLAAGLVAAVPTIISGLTDWVDTVGTQRRMGAAHALVNAGGVTLQLASLALRGSGRGRGFARFLSASGYIINAAAAYVGGELVFSLGRGVNRDAWVSGPKKFTDVAAEADLQPGKLTKFDVRKQPIVLLKDDDGIHAFNGTCPHEGCGLWDGELQGHIVTCPCHGSQFDVTDGSLIHGPATAAVPSYEVQLADGRIQVRLRE
jgi:nitrite reductase/ring-hydroxylating ferredoxin subunit/uncharacterized membrane protein